MKYFIATLLKDKLFLIIILVLALALRLDFLIANNFVLDADEAIVGLMAKHVNEGHEIPVFYYGQHYMGSFEALVTSLVFKIFGISGVALKSVPLFFSLVFILLIYLIGFELSQNHFIARISAIFAAVPPSALVIWSAKARGGFIELLCLGALALLLCMRWLKSKDLTFRGLSLIALVLGFGWWVNNQIIYFMLPIGFVVLGRYLHQDTSMPLKLGKIFIAFVLGCLWFFVGSLPFWLYNFEYDFVSFAMFRGSETVNVFEQFWGVLHTALPILLGAKRFWHVENIFSYSTVLVWTIFILLLLNICFYRWKSILGLFRFKINDKSGVECLLLFVFATLCVFSISSFGYLVEAPRYLLPLYCAIFPLSAYAIFYVYEKNPSGAYLYIVALLIINVCSSYLGGRAIPGEPFVFKGERVSKDHSELVSWLADNEHDWVRTNYWIGYRLAFETKEAVRFLIVQKPYQQRIEAYKNEAKELDKDRMPFVLVPAQAAIIEDALNALGYNYSSKLLSDYVVIFDIEPRYQDLEPYLANAFEGYASLNPEFVYQAFDDDLETRWASAKPQEAGMEFGVNFLEIANLKGLSYDMGAWRHDYPRELSIEVELGSGEKKEILSRRQYRAVRYLIEYDSSWAMYFEPIDIKSISFKQMGSHSVFDWSIAEIDLYK